MSGKTVVITGATAGIGEETAIALAGMGAHLVLVARNLDKAKATVDRISGEAPGADVQIVEGDLASFASVRAAAAQLLDVTERIDVLVNNAGIAALRSRVTDDGFDEMIEANYLGPFLLTHLLVDRLRASAPARVVVVGSEAHRVAGSRLDPERFEDVGRYSGLASQRVYGRSKLLDLLMADELSRRLEGTGVTVNSLCPGIVDTDLARESSASAFTKFAGRIHLARTSARGARMSVHLASSPSVEGVTGVFFSSTRGAGLMPKARPRRDRVLRERVYERTCELVGIEPLAPAEPVRA